MNDDEIKATVVEKLWSNGFIGGRHVHIDRAASFSIPTHDRGRAADLVNEMARDDTCPLRYARGTGLSSVTLEPDSEGWVRSWLLRHGTDRDDLPWDLK
jgi:hypothetical protein